MHLLLEKPQDNLGGLNVPFIQAALPRRRCQLHNFCIELTKKGSQLHLFGSQLHMIFHHLCLLPPLTPARRGPAGWLAVTRHAASGPPTTYLATGPLTSACCSLQSRCGLLLAG